MGWFSEMKILIIYIFKHTFLSTVTCESITFLNGQVTYDHDTETNGEYAVGTIATFTCNYGYSSFPPVLVLSTCETTSSWDMEAPACNLSTQN